MTAKTEPIVETQVLTAAEGREFFDQRCRALLNMTAEEFLTAYDSGAIWDRGDSEQVTELAMLVPFTR